MGVFSTTGQGSVHSHAHNPWHSHIRNTNTLMQARGNAHGISTVALVRRAAGRGLRVALR